MKLMKVALFLFLFALFPFCQTFADTLVIQNDGKVVLKTDTGAVKSFIFSHERFTDSPVLGASSGVVVTVSLSSFIPTDTPIPTSTPRPTPSPTQSTNSSFSTATPTPHTASSSPGLTTTIITPLDTTTQQVNRVIKEFPDQNPLIITPTSEGTKMILEQGSTQAVTNLPIQLTSDTNTPQVLIQGISNSVISPTSALQSIESVGTFIIPSTAQINLTTENDQPVYRITGSQHFQIFNTFIINLPLTIDVAAKTGKPVQVKNPFIVTFLEFLHIGKRVIH